ncbi:MAG TPA: hypothetical protein VIF14_11725 [Alphaproteobacteria bacterium]|jgi:hypothetical protein
MSIPIVNSRHEIVGWTDLAPVILRNRLRHRRAERLLGGPIHCVEIALTHPRDLAQAGAPRGWRSAWRCLALCSDECIGSLVQVAQFRPAAESPAEKAKVPPA